MLRPETSSALSTVWWAFLVGIGFRIGWDVIGWLLDALAARVG